MTVFGGLFVLFRHELPRLYVDDDAVVALAAVVLPIGAAFQVSDGAQVVGGGILRGMGRTRPAAAINLLAYWGLGLPIAWWLAFPREGGLPGLWWGLAAGLTAAAALTVAWIWWRGPARASVAAVPPRSAD
jgi:MATE family multidrug resistance protein